MRPESFPEGLAGIYHDYFYRLFPDGKVYDAFRPVLEVILAAREPVSAERIAGFLDVQPFDLRNDLQKIAPFFPEREGVISAYHRSVADWLQGLAGLVTMYRVDVGRGHRVISGRLLEDFRSGSPQSVHPLPPAVSPDRSTEVGRP